MRIVLFGAWSIFFAQKNPWTYGLYVVFPVFFWGSAVQGWMDWRARTAEVVKRGGRGGKGVGAGTWVGRGVLVGGVGAALGGMVVCLFLPPSSLHFTDNAFVCIGGIHT